MTLTQLYFLRDFLYNSNDKDYLDEENFAILNSIRDSIDIQIKHQEHLQQSLPTKNTSVRRGEAEFEKLLDSETVIDFDRRHVTISEDSQLFNIVVIEDHFFGLTKKSEEQYLAIQTKETTLLENWLRTIPKGTRTFFNYGIGTNVTFFHIEPVDLTNVGEFIGFSRINDRPVIKLINQNRVV